MLLTQICLRFPCGKAGDHKNENMVYEVEKCLNN